jgi:quercetin dioxygenase-like cupin family protein
MLITLTPGGSSGKHPYPAPVEEFAFVLTGSVILATDRGEEVLNAGDAAMIRASVMRKWHNVTSESTQILIVAVSLTGRFTPAGVSHSVRSDKVP